MKKWSTMTLWLLVSAAVMGCGGASDVYVPLRPARWIRMDDVTYAFIGRDALKKYGYEEIIRMGVEAGYLRYPEQPSSQNFVGQTFAEAARQAGPIFTKGAVAAGIVALMDSPAPGPADVVGLGMLFAAIAEAGYVGVQVWTSSPTATATPIPPGIAIPAATATTTTTSPPIAVPTTTTTTPPIALPRRRPKQSCDDKRLDELENAKDAVCPPTLRFPGEPCHHERPKDKARAQVYPCSLIIARIAAVKVCVAARQKVQDECFKNATDSGHAQQIDDLTRGSALCDALKLLNCAPGHPMSGL